MSRIAVLTTALVLASVGAASAQSTDFTGSWKLNAAQSNFGQMPAPSSLTQTIAQEPGKVKASIKQTSDYGEMAFEFTFTTDGKENLNDVNGASVKSVAKWDGPALLLDSTMDMGGSPMTMSDKWTLSADGKQLVIDRKVTGQMGSGDSKIVFDKQ